MKLPRLTCKRCGHTWIPRSEKKPRVCPKCSSPYWDRERIRARRKKEGSRRDRPSEGGR